ncbi:AAA ATPase central domain protein [Thiorhodococcus drewsii AZ1]|uniref:AAA ATPase central domain protein n=1 Tax=Thiorhodococcus drewsii AZ1 TaxID=765913 RepID=G2DWH2_9GAMM|nr:ATP-binding protein [Thiorhodococcus drewsii]EGV33672.1 AAA ATPase central domain protein [Thiorhodococcus drewsii AZ1]
MPTSIIPLLRKKPTCPTHGCELILSNHGTKPNPYHYLIEVVNTPLLYCPQCLETGQHTSVEVEPAASMAFLKQLVRLLDKSTFPGLLSKPKIRVDFNPTKTIIDLVPGGGFERPFEDAIQEDIAAPSSTPADPEQNPERLTGIEPVAPRHRLDQLILDPETLQQIREATNVLLSRDLLYETWNLASVARTGRRVALNFYGPPGTGKTLAADAVADLLEKRILKISYAELESKYVGETPKNIKAAFSKARETDALLFFDEADSILGKRLVDVSQSADNSINVARSTTLIELDNFEGAVIFASNLVSNYDTAFLRRMLAHVEFKLPATEQRERIWRSHIPTELPLAKDVDFATLADSSKGAAGGDILNAVLLAASYASMRPSESRVVTLADFERAIGFILEGKRKILKGPLVAETGSVPCG